LRLRDNCAWTHVLGLACAKQYTNPIQQARYPEALTPLNSWIYVMPAGLTQVELSSGTRCALSQERSNRSAIQSRALPVCCSLGHASSATYSSKTPNVNATDGPALDVLLQGHAAHVRPGKFMTKARAQLREADEAKAKEGRFFVEASLNWRDLNSDSATWSSSADPLDRSTAPSSAQALTMRHAYMSARQQRCNFSPAYWQRIKRLPRGGRASAYERAQVCRTRSTRPAS